MPRAKLGMTVRKNPYDKLDERVNKGRDEQARLEAVGRKRTSGYQMRLQNRIPRLSPPDMVAPSKRTRRG